MVARKKVTRTKKAKETKETQPPKKAQWLVLSGGISLLGQKTSYQKGDTFEAYEWDIPQIFKKSLRCLTPKEDLAKKPAKVEPKYFIREIVPSAEELDDPDFVQKYDIIDTKDKIVSDNLTKEEADAALKDLN